VDKNKADAAIAQWGSSNLCRNIPQSAICQQRIFGEGRLQL